MAEVFTSICMEKRQSQFHSVAIIWYLLDRITTVPGIKSSYCSCQNVSRWLFANRVITSTALKLCDVTHYFMWRFTFIELGNLPVERAKDTMCFLQRGDVSLALSAIIYNIVKVKVSRWPFRKRSPQGQLWGPPTYTVEMWPVDPFDPLTSRPVDPSTRWPVDPLTFLEKEPLKRNCEVHLHTPLRCRAAKGAELDSAAGNSKAKGAFCAVWLEAGANII